MPQVHIYIFKNIFSYYIHIQLLFKGSTNAARGHGNRGRNVLKFENDYDFEQANNKFEELRSQLSKIKVSEETKVAQVVSWLFF